MSHQQIEIWTERLLLRGAQESDLEAFCAWFRDPQAMQFWWAHFFIEAGPLKWSLQ